MSSYIDSFGRVIAFGKHYYSCSRTTLPAGWWLLAAARPACRALRRCPRRFVWSRHCVRQTILLLLWNVQTCTSIVWHLCTTPVAFDKHCLPAPWCHLHFPSPCHFRGESMVRHCRCGTGGGDSGAWCGV
jgi:hypothetical protein